MPILHWLTREEDIQRARRAPYRLLDAIPELSAGDSDSGNMLIQGDNMEALKALLPYYAGRVKCIYIDPPFNTGAAFDHYDDNVENSIWLSLMYQRLELLHQLLKDDGSIFVHLDDNQTDYCRILLDEIFGRKNFVNRITVDVRAPSAFSTVNPGVFKASEYILWFAKDKKKFVDVGARIPRDLDYAYKLWLTNPDDDYRKWKFVSILEPYSQVPRNSRIAHPKSLLSHFDKFVLENARQVCRLASISDTGAGEAVIELKRRSLEAPDEIFKLKRDKGLDDVYVTNGQQILFYSKNVSEIDGAPTPTTMLTNIWSDISWEGIASEGGVKFKKGKKPERLVRRCIELASNRGDIVLDSFLGSGTTAAVAQKLHRRWIGIELGENAYTHCQPRLRNVTEGEQSGISKEVGWPVTGGSGFRFYKLGESIFDDEGLINPSIRFPALAAHVWFSETGEPFVGKADKPFLGIYKDIAYALLYNGILGDKRIDGGNVLTTPVLDLLRKQAKGFSGPWVIYGEMSRFSKERLNREDIVFKQTPYDVRAR